MSESVVSADGTLVVPPDACAELGLQPGDTVTFTTMPSGTVLMARLDRAPTPPVSTKPPVRFGFARERVAIPDDFDAPLPDDVIRGFKGR